jgi:hydroxymethylglutaryl-CoA lyase
VTATGVTICEVSPRDGLQNDPARLTTDQKVELIARAVAAGARRIEAVSFAHPARVPAMADAEAVMAAVPRAPGVALAGLVMNERGLERALNTGVDEVNVVVVATDTFARRNQNMTTAESLALADRVVGEARAAGVPTTVTLAAAFGCPFEGEVARARVAECVARIAESGPAEIALADTIGVAVPAQVRDRLELSRARAGGTPLRVHLHDTRNTGVANAVAALDAGVAALDASVGGIGGCPFAPAATGNVATEDLVWALHRSGIATGLDLAALLSTASWLAGALGHDVPSALLKAGAFPPA